MTTVAAQEAADSLSLRERAGVRAARARELRQSATDAESLLWSRLRSRQLLDLKFRRQHPIGAYFADFACVDIGLVIELDGGQHNEASALASDVKRADAMRVAGYRTLRFWNNEVLTQTASVLEKIYQMAEHLKAEALTLTLSRARERGQDTLSA